MSSYNVDLVGFDLALQCGRWGSAGQPLAKMLGHRLPLRGAQPKLLGDLPVGEVQSHQVEAQQPHAQRLVVPGQHRAAQVVEPSMACLAQIALPVPLAVVMAVADHHGTVAVRTAYAIRPAMLTDKLKALGFVQQAREVDHVGYGHRGAASSNNRITSSFDQIRDLVSTLPPQSHHPGSRQERKRIATPRQKRLPEALLDDQVRHLLGYVRSPIHRTCLAVMYGCGLRISEAATLDFGAIDRANKVLRIIGKG